MSSASARPLSELEGVCLGLVSATGPCTAYRVRSELRASPSSHWQASAGSVYPLLKRLEAEGLLVTKLDTNDGRGRKLLRITRPGRQSLRVWILAGDSEDLIASATDPLRSRVFFLRALTAAQRAELVDRLIKQVRAYLLQTQTRLRHAVEAGDLFDELGCLGAMKLTEARLDWLRTVADRVRDTSSAAS